MRTGKWVVAVLLSAAMGASAPLRAQSTPKPKYKVRWLLAHRNVDFFEEAAQNFKRNVETGSHGDIAVEIVTAPGDGQDSSSVSAEDIPVKVSKGEAELGHSFVDVAAVLDPRLYAFEAPYLFRGYEHMEGVFEGPLGAEMLDGLRGQHVVGLSFTYSGGGCGVATIDRPIRRPEDLKGLKVGVYGDEVNAAWLTSLGATPVPIKHHLETIVPLAEKGSLDAVVTTWRNFDQESLAARFRYFNMPESTYLVSVTYANEKFFASLPEEYRALLSNASREAARIERAKTIELNENARTGSLGKGVLSVSLTSAQRARFAEALRPAYLGAIGRTLGEGLIAKIKGTGDARVHPTVPSAVAGR
jgi:TRAP-type C4-dicarboxylate transport system substrate-binding protein